MTQRPSLNLSGTCATVALLWVGTRWHRLCCPHTLMTWWFLVCPSSDECQELLSTADLKHWDAPTLMSSGCTNLTLTDRCRLTEGNSSLPVCYIPNPKSNSILVSIHFIWYKKTIDCLKNRANALSRCYEFFPGKTVDLLVALDEKSGDHECRHNSPCGEYEYV